jgi:hypothetical protein
LSFSTADFIFTFPRKVFFCILAQVIALDNTNTLTPNSIEWWAWIEKKYSRKVIKSDKNEYTNIGFLSICFSLCKTY